VPGWEGGGGNPRQLAMCTLRAGTPANVVLQYGQTTPIIFPVGTGRGARGGGWRSESSASGAVGEPTASGCIVEHFDTGSASGAVGEPTGCIVEHFDMGARHREPTGWIVEHFDTGSASGAVGEPTGCIVEHFDMGSASVAVGEPTDHTPQAGGKDADGWVPAPFCSGCWAVEGLTHHFHPAWP
jgi:hypothetical protein